MIPAGHHQILVFSLRLRGADKSELQQTKSFGNSRKRWVFFLWFFFQMFYSRTQKQITWFIPLDLYCVSVCVCVCVCVCVSDCFCVWLWVYGLLSIYVCVCIWVSVCFCVTLYHCHYYYYHYYLPFSCCDECERRSVAKSLVLERNERINYAYYHTTSATAASRACACGSGLALNSVAIKANKQTLATCLLDYVGIGVLLVECVYISGIVWLVDQEYVSVCVSLSMFEVVWVSVCVWMCERERC